MIISAYNKSKAVLEYEFFNQNIASRSFFIVQRNFDMKILSFRPLFRKSVDKPHKQQFLLNDTWCLETTDFSVKTKTVQVRFLR